MPNKTVREAANGLPENVIRFPRAKAFQQTVFFTLLGTFSEMTPDQKEEYLSLLNLWVNDNVERNNSSCQSPVKNRRRNRSGRGKAGHRGCDAGG